MNARLFHLLFLSALPAICLADDTIEFQEANITTVLKNLGRDAGLRVVVDHGVTGTVTLRLTETTAKEALDIVIKSKDLQQFESKDFLVIYDPDTSDRTVEEETTQDGIDEFVGAISASVQRAASDPAIAESFANFHWNYFQALKTRGFTEDQALRIVVGHQIPVGLEEE